MFEFITLNIPIKLDTATYKALKIAAEDKKTTPELLYAKIIENCEVLGSDQYFDKLEEYLNPYGYEEFLEEDE